MAALRSDLATTTGDNRVIRQPPGLSHVAEPVRVGAPVVLNLVMSRTPLGARCVFVIGQSLFTDRDGIATPGSEVRPTRQIGEEATRLRIELTAPGGLEPGRIELYLALEYDCGGKHIFDRTDTVTYQLLPSRRG
ncbi:MAG: hypothetical protein QM682_06345 [Paracoccus sp. (in: a-proteobacteria)]|uniref:hypothetical protein n=1 Tax=Paracoccus sp. TaxID=267 RepID=UPI0039E49B67